MYIKKGSRNMPGVAKRVPGVFWVPDSMTLGTRSY